MSSNPKATPGQLRWVRRSKPRPDIGEGVGEVVPVLQQAWKLDDDIEWRDVPIEEE